MPSSTDIIPQKRVRYIAPDGSLTQEGILFFLSLSGRIEDLASASDIAQAESVVASTFGDRVSVEQKAKNLNKFGRNEAVGTTYETVAEFQGTVANEVYLTTNGISHIVSSSASDTTQRVTIEGHTLDGEGNLTFVVQTVTLNGQTPVALTTALARATRGYINTSETFGNDPAALVGTVSVYDGTAVTSGVPNTATATKLLIKPDETTTEKAATTISSQDYWFLTNFTAGIGEAGGSAAYITVRMETRDVKNGGAWLPMGREIVLIPDSIGRTIELRPFLIVPKNHDWRVRARCNANTASVYAEAAGYLAKVI